MADEREDLVEALDTQRALLRRTLRDLSDDQARLRPTVSELSLGGLVKHVTRTEKQWADFVRLGPSAMGSAHDPDAIADWLDAFSMRPDETLEQVLAAWDAVARDTDELVRAATDLDATQPLPEAPWFRPGARWTVRRVVLHIVAELAQHSGHADILRESVDGAKTMG